MSVLTTSNDILNTYQADIQKFSIRQYYCDLIIIDL